MNACHHLLAIIAAGSLLGCAIRDHHDGSGGHGTKGGRGPDTVLDCAKSECEVSVAVSVQDGLCTLIPKWSVVNVLGADGDKRDPVTLIWKLDSAFDEFALTRAEIGNGDGVFDEVHVDSGSEVRVKNNRKFVDTHYKYQLFGNRVKGKKQLCASPDPWIYNK